MPLSVGWLGLAPKSWNKKAKSFFTGDEGYQEQRSKLTPEQQSLHDQYIQAIRGKGAGGAFGESADYYRDLIDPNSATAEEMFKPETRRFNEEIVPGISEQFAGMGAGGLSSSGFRNAAVNAGTDLSERLGAIRANLKSQGAAGLSNLAQGALNPVVENIEVPATGGLMEYAAPALTAAGAAFAGPAGAAAGNVAGNALSNATRPISGKGKSSPYGGPLSKTPGPNTYNSNPYSNTMQGWR